MRACEADELCTFCAQYVLGTKPNVWASFGEKYGQTSDVLWESETFLLIAGLGALTEGYVLLLPKDHYLSIGSLPQKQMDEFIRIKSCVRSLVQHLYGEVVFFEHGMSRRNPAGGCVEHAHLHACPGPADFRSLLCRYLEERPVGELYDLRTLAQSDTPYLFFEDQAGNKYIYLTEGALPSQYLRKLWAWSVGKPAEWNWSAFIGEENVAATIRRIGRALSERKFPDDLEDHSA